MKKLCVLLIVGLIAFTSCKKVELCTVKVTKTSLQPCEGYPKITVNIYENTYGQWVSGIKIDTVKYCSDGIYVRQEIITNCN